MSSGGCTGGRREQCHFRLSRTRTIVKRAYWPVRILHWCGVITWRLLYRVLRGDGFNGKEFLGRASRVFLFLFLPFFVFEKKNKNKKANKRKITLYKIGFALIADSSQNLKKKKRKQQASGKREWPSRPAADCTFNIWRMYV